MYERSLAYKRRYMEGRLLIRGGMWRSLVSEVVQENCNERHMTNTLNRRGPVGGFAYGTPRNQSTSHVSPP